GQPILATASNVAKRSGVTQLNHMVGLLAAHHVPMHLDYFYVRRQPRRLDWDGAPRSADGGSEPPAPEQPAESPPTDLAATNGHLPPTNRFSHILVEAVTQPEVEPETSSSLTPPMDQGGMTTGQAQVMADYMQVMEQFLDVQRELMEAFLGT